jgi:LPS-assembly protein
MAQWLATSALAGGAVVGPAFASEPMLFVEERLAPPASVSPADENGDSILFEAEQVTRATETSPIVAEGNVRAYFGARYLRADKLSWDPATDIVVAEGSVSITDENLQTVFAGRVELTGDLRDGVAENFSALLKDNARLAGDTAIREQGARTRLSHAVYTACGVCDSEGEGKTPTWRVKALRVTRDEERKVVRFRHAFFEVKGVPVLYAPFLQAPDPSVERQSGFLTPLIGASSRLGFNFELPYYLAISNHQDATFSPKYTSSDGVLWQGEYRRRGDHGSHVVQGGFIDYDTSRNLPGADTPGQRWHVFAEGYRDIGDGWRAGYDVERVSDDLYLRNYDINRRGDLRKELDTSSTNRLRSSAFVQFEDANTLFTARNYVFQGLRVEDTAELTPYVLPIMDYRRDVDPPGIGGRGLVNLNFASLQRTGGVDTRRLSASMFWEREWFTKGGHRLGAFAELRGDGFFYSDLDEGNEVTSGAPLSPGAVADPTTFDVRFAPSVGVEWSYPLVNQLKGVRIFIEPHVQLVASPTDRNDASILNEDSQSVEFDFASLFDYNKSPGFDAFEDGQRMNAGLSAGVDFDNGLKIDGGLGAQYRLQETSAFTPQAAPGATPPLFPTGLGEQRSDYVGSLNLRYKTYVGIENRFRLDDDGGGLRRAESMGYLNAGRFSGYASYVRLNEENVQAGLSKREELNGLLNVRATKHWRAGFGWRRDLVTDKTVRQDFIVAYEDECALFEVTYRRDRTQDVLRGLEEDNAFLVRFTLRSLVN